MQDATPLWVKLKDSEKVLIHGKEFRIGLIQTVDSMQAYLGDEAALEDGLWCGAFCIGGWNCNYAIFKKYTASWT